MIRLPSGISSPAEPVGIPASVPPFVLVADDPRDVAEPGQDAQDALADHRVLPHQAPLVVGQRSRLVEDLVRDRDLADVVQQRGRLDAPNLGHVQPEVARNRAGHLDHGLGVLARVAVALEQRHGQCLDRVALGGVRVLLLLGGIRGQHRAAAAHALRVQARHARIRKQSLGAHSALERGDAHRRAGGADRALADHLELDQQALERRQRALSLGVGEQDPEFGLAEAPELVVGAGGLAQTARHSGHQLVAGLEAVAQLERPEVVDRDHGQRQHPLVAPRAVHLLREPAAECAHTQNPGDAVEAQPLGLLGLELRDPAAQPIQLAEQLLLLSFAEHPQAISAIRPDIWSAARVFLTAGGRARTRMSEPGGMRGREASGPARRMYVRWSSSESTPAPRARDTA